MHPYDHSDVDEGPLGLVCAPRKRCSGSRRTKDNEGDVSERLRRPIHPRRVTRSVINFFCSYVWETGASNVDSGIGRREDEQDNEKKTLPERNDVPAFISPFCHDGPVTEECDVPQA